ncbi:MAG: pyridoxamine 5'-phosphate oxidase family protein [Clostridiales bacterium]|nr:pyridoxamine 5'-phosphate oxidase family protein [Clostridiales bacterium]
MNPIEKIEAFFKEAPTFYLATISQNKPKCRPIGFHLLENGNIYFGVGTFKDVYKQLQENPYAEICACKGGRFLRYYGKAVFEETDQIAASVLAKSPELQKIYNETTGYKLGIFHLEEAAAELHGMSRLEERWSL